MIGRIAMWVAHTFFGRGIDRYVAARGDVLFAYLKGSIIVHDIPADRKRFAIALMWSMRKLMKIPTEGA